MWSFEDFDLELGAAIKDSENLDRDYDRGIFSLRHYICSSLNIIL